jgi:predicted TIM-barrel fold metal-dependent hydrolase
MRDGLLVVDAHTHIQLTEHTMAGRDGRLSVVELIDRMDRYGIDGAFVIAHAWAGWKLSQYQAEHDRVATAIADHQDRLVGFCWADPLLGPAAVAELRRCVVDLGYKGLKLHPVYQRFSFDGPQVRPLIETAAELGIPVTAHLDLRVQGSEPWRMIALAETYPEVTFVMAHMGRDLQALQDLSFARAAADVPNVLLEGSSTATDAYGTFEGPAVVLGPERVLYASDAGPFHHPAVNLLKIDLLNMDRTSKARILGLNACRLVQWDPDSIRRAPDWPAGTYDTPSGVKTYACPATGVFRLGGQ